MPSRSALAKIHIAKKELNISDDNYRELLSGWCVEGTKKPVSSSTELTDRQAEDLLATLKKIGFVAKPSKKQLEKTADEKKRIIVKVPANRPDEFATQKQINMLAAIWYQCSNEKTVESFIKYVLRIVKINAIEWLQKDDVQKVKKAIEALENTKFKSKPGIQYY